jgi:23S rRNA pseudouridine1911/1915/1917 synthase
MPRRGIPPGAPGHPADKGSPRDARPSGRTRPAPDSAEHRSKPSRRPTRAEGGARVEFLFQDEDIIAVDKPSGLPVIAPDGSRTRSLYDIVTERLRRTNPKGRAAVVHRIDRDTSGIVVFATNARAKRILMEGWDELVERRRYVALVEGGMAAEEGRLDSWLAENRAGTVFESSPGARGAKRAVSTWRLIASGGGRSLIELELETGRKHQIRVQLAAAGHPVVGDDRYGAGAGSRGGPGRLCLHAAGITLAFPGKKRILLDSPAPPSFRAALTGGSG